METSQHRSWDEMQAFSSRSCWSKSSALQRGYHYNATDVLIVRNWLREDLLKTHVMSMYWGSGSAGDPSSFSIVVDLSVYCDSSGGKRGP